MTTQTTRSRDLGRVLLVDDEPRVLAAYQRQLRNRFDVVTAEGAEAALNEHSRGETIAVVVSDLRMPSMDGLQLLAEFRTRSPNTIRLMLTGDADLSAAQAAVNQGQVFRFLTKPCEPPMLASAIDDALIQYSLERAEHELLANTLNGAVRLLAEMVSLADGQSQALVPAVRVHMSHLCDELGMSNWEFDVAATLCQLGNLTLPADVAAQLVHNGPTDSKMRELQSRGTDTTAKLLSEIPRLDDVGRIIGDSFDPPALEDSDAADNTTAAGAIMLHLAIRWAQLSARDTDAAQSAAEITAAAHGRGSFAERVVRSLVGFVGQALRPREVEVKLLNTTMVLNANVTRTNGTKLLSAGTPLTGALIERIATFAHLGGVSEPIHVLEPDTG